MKKVIIALVFAMAFVVFSQAIAKENGDLGVHYAPGHQFNINNADEIKDSVLLNGMTVGTGEWMLLNEGATPISETATMWDVDAKDKKGNDAALEVTLKTQITKVKNSKNEYNIGATTGKYELTGENFGWTVTKNGKEFKVREQNGAFGLALVDGNVTNPENNNVYLHTDYISNVKQTKTGLDVYGFGNTLTTQIGFSNDTAGNQNAVLTYTSTSSIDGDS